VGKDPLKIMIIDDNARFRALVRKIISDPSDTVLELDDGAGVADAYTAFHPDWVLMDVHMKVVDGMEATRQLMASFPEAKVIFLSNFTNKRLVAKGLGLGAKAYLSKEDIFAVKPIIRSESASRGIS